MVVVGGTVVVGSVALGCVVVVVGSDVVAGGAVVVVTGACVVVVDVGNRTESGNVATFGLLALEGVVVVVCSLGDTVAGLVELVVVGGPIGPNVVTVVLVSGGAGCNWGAVSPDVWPRRLKG